MAVVVLAVTPMLAQDTAKQKQVDVTGTWEMTVESPQGSMTVTANYKQEGEILTGTHVSEMGEAPLKGTVKGTDISYTLTIDMQGQQFTIAHTGKYKLFPLVGVVFDNLDPSPLAQNNPALLQMVAQAGVNNLSFSKSQNGFKLTVDTSYF